VSPVALNRNLNVLSNEALFWLICTLSISEKPIHNEHTNATQGMNSLTKVSSMVNKRITDASIPFLVSLEQGVVGHTDGFLHGPN
jgi:hypothetical protein